MNKKVLATAIGTFAIGGAMILPTSALAQSVAPSNDMLIQKLSSKLGVDESTLSSAFTQAREEIHAERQAQLEQAIDKALSEGGLTQRQADILKAIPNAMEKIKVDIVFPSKEDIKNLSADERRDAMQALHEEREEALLEALNNQGLNTTNEEVEQAKDTAKTLGIMPMGFTQKNGINMGHGRF